MDKLERLTNLLLVLLSAERPMTLDEIVHTVEGYPAGKDARRQAFERDKRILREQGIEVLLEPVPGSADAQGYRIDPDSYYLADLGLSDDEQEALNLALAAVRVDEEAGLDAAWKLGAAGPPSGPVVAQASLPSTPALPVFHEAIRKRTPVEFVHRGARRRLEPYGLLFRDGFWYVVGRDRERDALRSFRIDRISGVPESVPGQTFTVPADVDWRHTMPAEPWSMGEGPTTVATVLVDPVYARTAEVQSGSEAVSERRSDGSVVLRLPVVNLDLFRSWVIEMVGHAEILSPPELRADLAAWVAPLAGVG